MEYSKHKILTGKGAMEYAKSNGFVVESNDNMLSANTKKAYEVNVQECIVIHHFIPYVHVILHSICTCNITQYMYM